LAARLAARLAPDFAAGLAADLAAGLAPDLTPDLTPAFAPGEALLLGSACLGMSPMMLLTGHTENAGHFLQPTTRAMGHRVMMVS